MIPKPDDIASHYSSATQMQKCSIKYKRINISWTSGVHPRKAVNSVFISKIMWFTIWVLFYVSRGRHIIWQLSTPFHDKISQLNKNWWESLLGLLAKIKCKNWWEISESIKGHLLWTELWTSHPHKFMCWNPTPQCVYILETGIVRR